MQILLIEVIIMNIEELKQIFPENSNPETKPSSSMIQKNNVILALKNSLLLETNTQKINSLNKEILRIENQLKNMKPVVSSIGYCYVTYCIDTGEFYVGKRQAKKFSDIYYGSGAKVKDWKLKNYKLEHWPITWANDSYQLLEQEHNAVSKAMNYNDCVNINPGGSPAMLGKRHSPETIQKMRESASKIKHKPMSQKTKDKISASNKGKHNKSKEQREAIGNFHRGRKRSEETCRKIGDSKRGENNPNYGKPRSEEVKRKISEANKRRKNNE